MKRLSIVAIVSLMALAQTCQASVPPMISYQGKLMQPSGAPVPDGPCTLQFAIYNVPAGGTPLWSETNTGVLVKGGLFSVLLGGVVNLPANIFDEPNRWFGVKVGTDLEMTPRQQVASVAFAVKAASADVAATVPDGAITTSKVADGAITAGKLAPGVAVPPGTILMWSGATAAIPQGWTLCNGQNGTPDLRNRFIVGAGDGYAVAATGGEKFHTLTVAEMPAHGHGPGNTYNETFDVVSGLGQQRNWVFLSASSFKDLLTGVAGGDQPHENRPPYYALCFIMKLGY